MAYQDYIIPGLAGLSGVLSAGPTKVKSKLDPAAVPLKNSILQQYNEYLKMPNLTGYEATGVDSINRQSDARKRNLQETLAARGVNGPAVAFALDNEDENRFSNIFNFRSQVPLLAHDLQGKALANAGGFINSLPREQETSGNRIGEGVTSFSESLAAMYGEGKIGPEVIKNITGAGAISKLGAALGITKTGAAVTGASAGMSGSGAAAAAASQGAISGGSTATLGSAGASGGGLVPALTALASNPITWAAAAGLGAIIAYKKIGQGRKTADNFNSDVHDTYFKPGEGAISKIVDNFDSAFTAGKLDRNSATQIRSALSQALAQYKADSMEFAQQGENEEKVVRQNFDNLTKVFGGDLTNLLRNMDQKIATLG